MYVIQGHLFEVIYSGTYLDVKNLLFFLSYPFPIPKSF